MLRQRGHSSPNTIVPMSSQTSSIGNLIRLLLFLQTLHQTVQAQVHRGPEDGSDLFTFVTVRTILSMKWLDLTDTLSGQT